MRQHKIGISNNVRETTYRYIFWIVLLPGNKLRGYIEFFKIWPHGKKILKSARIFTKFCIKQCRSCIILKEIIFAHSQKKYLNSLLDFFFSRSDVWDMGDYCRLKRVRSTRKRNCWVVFKWDPDIERRDESTNGDSLRLSQEQLLRQLDFRDVLENISSSPFKKRIFSMIEKLRLKIELYI